VEALQGKNGRGGGICGFPYTEGKNRGEGANHIGEKSFMDDRSSVMPERARGKNHQGKKGERIELLTKTRGKEQWKRYPA